jgi:hypothetical protein
MSNGGDDTPSTLATSDIFVKPVIGGPMENCPNLQRCVHTSRDLNQVRSLLLRATALPRPKL